ncbi:MAG: L,D-transpeptidase [Gammaproteobacteria bacterium]|nr:L,D-transpeptidase [Gammaproteobacteria bacterium]MCY4164810.1 L,D-transpeptidase [Gammaproteobacteria bacterium]MCY4255226.1 L,D-transpeptidase [Gammaproteobacteria bacterium]
MPGQIVIDIARQTLMLADGAEALRRWPVSTSRYGPGELEESLGTPRGRHRIRARIGAGQPPGAVFLGRRPTGEIYSRELARKYPARDWILSRILWLGGEQPGFNRHGKVDSMRRYIYIHGTPDSEPMSVPRSHGCVRMRNTDVMALFDRVAVGCQVDIQS